MATAADLISRIAALETRISAIAGVKGTAIGDQRTDFDIEGAHAELPRLRTELAQQQSTTGSLTRVAAFDKGV